MTSPQRLFDCLDILLEKGDKPDLLCAKENGEWKKYSARDVKSIVDQLTIGLLQTGIGYGDGTDEGRDKVAVLSKNRPEWIMLDLAVQQTGAVLAPFYPTIHINELEYTLNDAQVKLMFVNSADDLEKVLSIKHRVPSLREIYTFEKVENAKHWKELFQPVGENERKNIESVAGKIKNSDLVTIIYTSGTTGKPKGVMLSHNNILSNVVACAPCLPVSDLRSLSFLPLNHIFERMITYFYLYKEASIYYAESLESIGDNLKEVKPNIFTTVPRLLEKVYDKIMKKGTELTGVKKKLFFWAHGLAEKFEINKNQGVWYNLQLALANKLVFSKWRDALGNNLLCIVSGGAACQVRLIRIFTAAKIPILEGYGLTETSPVICVNRFQEEMRRFGTVGPAIDNVELKIAGDGEILCKGSNVMMGYYKHPELTKEVMDGEWFHTGDIGTLVEGKYLKITDRKKEMFKTSGGKYVAPLPIENKLKESIYIEQAMVLGADKKYVGALIIPSFANLKDWAKSQGIEDRSNHALVKNPKVKDFYRELIESFNKFFNHVEQVKRFELLPEEWSVEGGELTPKLSMKRKVIMEKSSDAIDRIYPSN
ncbi:MAG: long-chain fatty acid--CoA ligase [Chitinophagaceae bacterium]|nr:long-chain fatty acid--CoA ligase [Chitinophagaceae bacterium]